VVVGVGGVGKSCLTIQYIADKFIEDYDPTLEDSYHKTVTVDGENCVLDICDTAGQDDFSAIRDQYYQTGDGFLCVYAIVLQTSFSEVTEFHDAILRVKDVEKIPFVLVGNKCDLESERKITYQQGEELAKTLGCKFLEASAKTRTNVDESFVMLVREIMESRKSSTSAVAKDTGVKKKSEKKSGGGCSLL
jgi:GTPase KRas protein